MAIKISRGMVIAVVLIVTLSGCSSLPWSSQAESTPTKTKYAPNTPLGTSTAGSGGDGGTAAFHLLDLTVESPVERGETATVTVTVENRGEAVVNQNVSLHIKGDNITAGPGAVDIVFVVDDSKSMSEDIDTVRNELETFQETLESQGVNTQYAVVTVTGGVGIEQQFTPNVTHTQRTLRQIDTTGSEEYNYRAIDRAIEMEGRAHAQRVIIDLTDEPTDRNTTTDPTQTGLARKLEKTNTTFIAVSPNKEFIANVTEHGSGPHFEGGNNASLDKRVLANRTSTGVWFNLLQGDFGEKFTNEIATEVTTVSRTAQKEVRLNAGNTTKVTFEVETANLPEGAYKVNVYSQNSSLTTSLTVKKTKT